MSRLPRFGAPTALVLVVFLALGCGGTVIETSNIEDQIEADVEKSQQTKVSSVDCPSDVKVDPGAKFSCVVRLSDGGTKTATLLIRDEDANVSLLKLEANK